MHYKIIADGEGSGGFLSPPGHPNHRYTLHGFTSPRGRKVILSASIEYALQPESGADGAVKARVRSILNRAELKCSEAWVRHVYGYFRTAYAPESGTRNVAEAVYDKTNSLPAERHLAFLCVREYFPNHEPRTDLIADPGKGYGSWPCLKCGQRVQYEARQDAHAVVHTHTTGSGRTLWRYDVTCPQGGAHSVE